MVSYKTFIFVILLELVMNNFGGAIENRCEVGPHDTHTYLCNNLVLNQTSISIENILKRGNITKIVFKNSIFIDTFIIERATGVPHFDSIEFINCQFESLTDGALNMDVKELLVERCNTFFLRPLRVKDTLHTFSMQDLLRYPPLAELSGFLASHPNLKKLELNKIDLGNVTASFFQPLQILSEIKLNDTNINVSSLSNFPKLEVVNLTYNKINELPPEFLNSSRERVRDLNLLGNPLEKVDAFDFTKFTSLVNLYLPYDGDYSCSWLKGNQKISEKVNCVNAPSSETHEASSGKVLMIIAIIFFCIMLILLVFCAVKKFCYARRTRSSQDPKSARYSAVYRTTVEPTNPSA